MNEIGEEKSHWTVWASQQQACMGKPFVVKHFVSLGVSRRTVLLILEWFESGEALERKNGSGRKPLKLPQSKQELAGETGVLQCWCVTALFGQEAQYQQLSLTCIMYWRKLVWSTTSARRPLILLQLKSRGSQPGWGKWSWDPVRAARLNQTLHRPPSSPNWALLGSPEGRSLQGWLASRNGGSWQLKCRIRIARCLRDMDWEAVRSRMDRRKTDIRKAANKSQIFL